MTKVFSHIKVLNDKVANDNKSLESNQIQKQPSSTLESTNLNYQQSIMQPVYENMMNELKIPSSSSSSLPTTNSSNMINENSVSTTTTTSIAVVTSSSSMNDNPIQQNLQTSNAAPAPTISLLPMQENHYSLYSHPPQYHHYMHHQQQQQQQMNQYPLINSTPAITTATVTVSTQQQQQQSQLYQHSNPEMHS